MSVVGIWDAGVFDRDRWYEPTPPPGAGWGDRWRFWYQTGRTVEHELTELVVEARWETDSYTAYDGSYRGDIQPGKATVRFWDPGRILDALNPSGALWAHYRPNGFTWFWFYDSISRGLFAPDDPQAADVVFTGLAWPERLTIPAPDASLARGIEPIATRLAFLAAWPGSQPALLLPLFSRTGPAWVQSQNCAGLGADAQGVNPVYLQALRDAAVYGCYWHEGLMSGGGDMGYQGYIGTHYERWDTVRRRPLDPSQIVVGPPVTAAVDLCNGWLWKGTDSSMTTATDYTPGLAGSSSASRARWGMYQTETRAWDVTIPAVQNGLRDTSFAVMDAKANPPPAGGYLSAFSCQSGGRWTPAGKPSATPWDPAAHVWRPTDVAEYTDAAGGQSYYRVTKSAHQLTAKAWITNHALEPFIAAVQLPP